MCIRDRLLATICAGVIGACGDGGAAADHEVSTSLDLEDLQPLLARFAAKVDGFADRDVAALTGAVGRMRVGSAMEWRFSVRDGAVKTRLRIQVLLDDPTTVDFYLLTNRHLASTLETVLIAYMEEQGK